MFSDDDPRNSAMSMKDYVIMATDELGMLSMAAEDVMSIVSTYEAYMNNVTANKFSDSSPDRQFRPQVQDAVKVLAQLRALELVLPSADLKRFNRQLQGLLERKYTETIPKTMPKD
jgi:hypothetical protein